MKKSTILLSIIGALFVSHVFAEDDINPYKDDKYFIGQESFLVNSADGEIIRNRYAPRHSVSNFAGHRPTKSVPLKKNVQGYEVYCVSQAGVALSDHLYSYGDMKIKYATFNFCDENVVSTILKKAQEMKKPNFVEGLKLIKITHKNQEHIAYLVLVDEKSKTIYTNNGIHYTIPSLDIESWKDKSKLKERGVGDLIGNSKTGKYCFSGKNLEAMHPFYEAYGEYYTPHYLNQETDETDKNIGRCGKLIKNGTAKYQLVPTENYFDSDYKYGFRHATVE